jgi:hypothetical protein
MASDAAIEAMVADLVEQGFQLVSDTYSAESFGNWLREFHSPELWIIVARERGRWSVEVAPSGSALWFSLEAWAACVKVIGTPDVLSPAQLSEFVRSSLPALRAAVLADRSLGSSLDRAERALQARRLVRVPQGGLGAAALLKPTASSGDARQEAARRLAQDKQRRREQRQKN